jgi:predicted nucleotidyltransferase component of viral defense system
MIPQRNLSLLSNRLFRKGGRRIPETVLERDYCISWFLVGLSHSPLKKLLVFKGGTAIKKCYIPNYRFSEDLDFTLVKKFHFENIKKNLNTAFMRTQKASGIKLYFSRYDHHTHENSYTFFLGYEGPIPRVSGREVKVDITINEQIVFPIEERTVLREYDEYEDLPENAAIPVYSLNEITAEKVVGLLDRARNEPRDLYDIWYLTDNRFVDLTELVEAIEQKWRFRGVTTADMREELLRKEVRLKKLWKMRLSSQMVILPEFDEVYRPVQRSFRQAGLLKDR